MPSGADIARCAADGNLTIGILVINNTTFAPTRGALSYVYASDTAAIHNNALARTHSGGGSDSSVSNSTSVYFTALSNTEKYNIAANTSTGTPALSGSCNSYKGAADGTRGIIPLGGGTATTNIVTFASDTWAPGTAFPNTVSNSSTNGLATYNPGVNV
jgi:hypothetical protein